MAYMDVAPKGEPNGRTMLLLHGRNFPSVYWQSLIEELSASGYRVVAPDQIGFNKSSKPAFDLHFDQLARNTAALLDDAQDRQGRHRRPLDGRHAERCVSPACIRSASRSIVLDAPIGLEDYRLYVPQIPAERLMEIEDKVTPESYSTSSSRAMR